MAAALGYLAQGSKKNTAVAGLIALDRARKVT
jgi:hypothetical protein